MDKTLELITQVKFDELKKDRNNRTRETQTREKNGNLKIPENQKF
jgi:hypothetical protein